MTDIKLNAITEALNAVESWNDSVCVAIKHTEIRAEEDIVTWAIRHLDDAAAVLFGTGTIGALTAIAFKECAMVSGIVLKVVGYLNWLFPTFGIPVAGGVVGFLVAIAAVKGGVKLAAHYLESNYNARQRKVLEIQLRNLKAALETSAVSCRRLRDAIGTESALTANKVDEVIRAQLKIAHLFGLSPSMLDTSGTLLGERKMEIPANMPELEVMRNQLTKAVLPKVLNMATVQLPIDENEVDYLNIEELAEDLDYILDEDIVLMHYEDAQTQEELLAAYKAVRKMAYLRETM